MRISPLPTAEWTNAEREAIALGVPEERRTQEGAGNALATLVRHPELAQAYAPLSVHLKDHSTLPLALRELIILRVADRTACEYQWIHHGAIAAMLGLHGTADMAAGREAATRSGDTAALAAVDELLTDFRISDSTWAALGAALDDRQRMDLVFTVGGYAMLAMAVNSFGVEVEDAHWRAAASQPNKANEQAPR